MAKRRFTEHERFAVHEAHGGTCQYCLRSCTLEEMHVDHIIPESLMTDPKQLSAVLAGFGLSSDFDLNSFENWVPSHPHCNRRKSDVVFDATPLMQDFLRLARERASKAQAIARRSVTKAAITRAESLLIRSVESGEYRRKDIELLFGRLIAAERPEHFLFMENIAKNSLGLNRDVMYAFSVGDLQFEVNSRRDESGQLNAIVSAKTTADLKFGNIVIQGVELRMDYSTSTGPSYSVNMANSNIEIRTTSFRS